MGNLIVSVNWQSKDTLNPQDELIRQNLMSLAQIHELSIDIEPNNILYKENYREFGAGVEGLKLVFFRDVYKKQITKFINMCAWYLNSMNVIWRIQLDDLPRSGLIKLSSPDFVDDTITYVKYEAFSSEEKKN